MTNPTETLQTDSTSSLRYPARQVVESIVRLFHEHGSSLYGEQVTQLEHALQCAMLAQQHNASTSLIVAALLHDIGHMLDPAPVETASPSHDSGHEDLAAQWLAEHFGPDVVEPVRLHVAAKRFLCATDPVYFGRLSGPSQASLKLQGGPMSTSEVGKFLSLPHYRDAVMLRRWDDEAKVVGLETRRIEDYLSALAECVR